MDISDLNSKIDKLEGVVKQLEGGKKDRWDKFQIFAAILIPASIALAGYFVSASLKMAEIESAKLIADGNQMSASSIAMGQQKVAEINAKVAQAQLVLSFLEILTGENPKKRKLAIESILIALPKNGRRLVSTVAINDESEDVKNFARLKLESIDLEIKDYPYFKNTAYFNFNPDSKSFDLVNAYWLIEAAMIVYMEDPKFIKEKFREAGLNDVVLIRDPAVQCYVASNDKFAIVTFGQNMLWSATGYNFIRHIVSTSIALSESALMTDWENGGKVHRGFKSALDSIWIDLVIHLEKLHKNKIKIWFTGHGIGAALATLAADRYGNIDGLYIYGSPRVGNENFSNDFFQNTYRFVNNSDILSRYPTGVYHHVGNFVFIDSGGRIHDNQRSKSWTESGHKRNESLIGLITNNEGKLPELPEGIIGPILYHAPTLYARNIWNNILKKNNSIIDRK